MLTSLSFSCWYKSNLRFVRLNCLSEAVRQKATIRLEGLASRFLSERPIYKCCNLPFNFIRWSKLYVNLFKIFTITIFGYLIYLTINKIYLVYRSKFSFLWPTSFNIKILESIHTDITNIFSYITIVIDSRFHSLFHFFSVQVIW